MRDRRLDTAPLSAEVRDRTEEGSMVKFSLLPKDVIAFGVIATASVFAIHPITVAFSMLATAIHLH